MSSLELLEGPCVYCGEPSEGNFAIHRDGFGEGPEVPLCDACGSEPTPTCAQIWAHIAYTRQLEQELDS